MKLIIEEIEREETAWREDLYSSDRKFAEYYNVLLSWLLKPLNFLSIHVTSWTFWSTWICSFNAILLLISIIYDASFCSWKVLEQILGVLIKLVKEIKLQHQYRYVSLVGLSNACLEKLLKLSWWHVWTYKLLDFHCA